ncbi:MAG TPA: peptide chain release factor N(5)-glutamine methyltransferase [Acidimicrobiales bacterium]|nr:peptide chain release factor N(5)-glutamine methyltransferase [Acidimicrobiales bacterium]
MTAGTWGDRHARAARRLGSEREAAWLVEEASGYAWPACAGGAVAELPGRRFESLLERRSAGEPLQYVLGRWPFRTIELMVDRRVLIPRPETEQVVEVALRELDRLGRSRPVVVDLGTGSGAIALAVAWERASATVWATERSPAALDVARANAAGLDGAAATRLRFAEGDWWDALPADLQGRIDLAVSNPPYVSSAEMRGLDPVVADWEPRPALESGPTGLEAVQAVLGGAPRWLAPGGAMVMELAPHQAEAARAAAAGAGLVGAVVHPDLAGRPRALVAHRAAGR